MRTMPRRRGLKISIYPAVSFKSIDDLLEFKSPQDAQFADVEVPTMGDECQPTGSPVPATEPSLAEKVSAIINNSASERNHKYFNPPTEARYLSNRNVARAMEGPMSPVAQYERPIGPSDIDLDSTSCPSNFDPPFTFVRLYILKLLRCATNSRHSITLNNSSTTCT